MDWLIIAIGMALAALIIIATVVMMRHREEVRAAAREAEGLNVISDDTRHAYWISAADHSGTSDSSSDSGGGHGGD